MGILLATGSQMVNDAIRNLRYDISGEIYERSELRKACFSIKPEIVIISENLKGRDKVLVEEMLFIKSNDPTIRIIYLAGNIDIKNKDKVNRLASLVFAGIYDIYGEKKLTITALKELIDHPRKYEDVIYLTRYLKKESLTQDSFVELESADDLVEDVESDGYKNVILVSSVKPGSGKSFISTNIAAGVAKFGKHENGSPMKTLIIDADLQNLSVGTLLDCEDEKFNLYTASQKIQSVLNKEGDLVGTNKEIIEVNDFVKRCCLPCKNVKNLYVIAGSQLGVEEVEKITPYIYVYMIELLSKDYDFVIVDSNSSLFHTTTYPMLKLSSKIYYILNLDYNNIRNNQRYKKDLRQLEVDKKIKYVLNEDIIATENRSNENLLFGADYIEKNLKFDLIAKIPTVDKPIFLNRIFKAMPLILDDNDYTLKPRLELLKIISDITEVDEYYLVKARYEKFLDKRRGLRKPLGK